MAKAPLVTVKERFTSKEKLVDAVQKLIGSDLWIDRVNKAKGLARVSNAKLLRLHAVLSDAKERFGTREKLVGAILELAKRSKDKGYASRLDRYPLPQLLDMHRSLTRAQKRASAKPQPVAKPKAKKAKPAKAKKEAAEKPAEAKAAPAKTAEAKSTPKKSAPKAEKPAAKKAAKK